MAFGVAAFVSLPFLAVGGWQSLLASLLVCVPAGWLLGVRAGDGSTLVAGCAFGTVWAAAQPWVLGVVGPPFAALGVLLLAPFMWAVMCLAGITWALAVRLVLRRAADRASA